MSSLELVDATLDGTVTYEMYIAPSFSNLNSMSFVTANGSN
jgi:acyl-coenzyme A thioesterase 13